jgi:DNA ligase-1
LTADADWNGVDTLYTRNNKPLHAPKSFLEQLPRGETCDGELFLRRNAFSETVSIVRSHSKKHWDRITFMIFDLPSHHALPFEERLAKLRDLFPDAPEFKLGCAHVPAGEAVVTLLEHIECQSREDMASKLALVEKVGGEGLMLRQPKSAYAFTRSGTLLKLKSFYDAEARVVGYEAGKVGLRVFAVTRLTLASRASMWA